MGSCAQSQTRIWSRTCSANHCQQTIAGGAAVSNIAAAKAKLARNAVIDAWRRANPELRPIFAKLSNDEKAWLTVRLLDLATRMDQPGYGKVLVPQELL